MTYTVIDVSEHQGKIDWEKAWKSKAFSAVILRCGYGSNERSHDDKQWIRNVSECERLGIPYGVYLYSYSDGRSIQSEIDHVIRLIKGHSPAMPVYIDLEESKYGKAFLNNANVFCAQIAKKGYKAGVYSGAYLFGKYLMSLPKQYSRWVAAYGKNIGGKVYNNVKPTFDIDAWQYTSTKSIPGIQGNVDASLFYTYYMDKLPETKTQKQEAKTDMSFTPITDYSKYYNKVSNCGSDENGGIRGGKAGDQTGREWRIGGWTYFGQNQIIRFNDRDVANTFATLSIRAAQNDNDGYDQGQRTTYYKELSKAGVDFDPKKIKKPNESDCSSGVLSNSKAALYLTGHKEQADKISVSDGWTGNIVTILRKAGVNMTVFTDTLHCKSNKYQLPGDINNNSSRHVNVNLGVGSMMSKADVVGKPINITEKNAIKKLQTALNTAYGTSLKEDGKRGKNTNKVIDNHYLYYRKQTIQNAHVRWFQEMLKYLGYAVDIDGSFGPQCDRITRQFQEDHNLEVDGCAGVATHGAILDAIKNKEGK